MNDHRIDGFFYGLFMDEDVLAESNIAAENPRHAFVNDYALFIGSRATLAPSVGAKAYGMVFALTHEELERLYGGIGLEDYRPEMVLATSLAGGTISALCYNLPEPPKAHEANPEYASKLRETLTRLGFPAEYISGIS